ncbi:hypothetical protein VPH35_129968 [Triticum aestivum]
MKGTSNPLERGYLKKSIAFRPFNARQNQARALRFFGAPVPSRPVPSPSTYRGRCQKRTSHNLHYTAHDRLFKLLLFSPTPLHPIPTLSQQRHVVIFLPLAVRVYVQQVRATKASSLGARLLLLQAPA